MKEGRKRSGGKKEGECKVIRTCDGWHIRNQSPERLAFLAFQYNTFTLESSSIFISFSILVIPSTGRFATTSMSDPRFVRLKSDPRFRRPKKKLTKVVVDERFKSVFAKEKKKNSKFSCIYISAWAFVDRFNRAQS